MKIRRRKKYTKVIGEIKNAGLRFEGWSHRQHRKPKQKWKETDYRDEPRKNKLYKIKLKETQEDIEDEI